MEVYDAFVTERIPETIRLQPVKIAILDTGLDMTHRDVEARVANIRGTCNWTNGRVDDTNIMDCNGHGTHTAGLILDYAVDAELYVAKIADNEPCHPDTVARVCNSTANNSSQDLNAEDYEGHQSCYRCMESGYYIDVIRVSQACSKL